MPFRDIAAAKATHRISVTYADAQSLVSAATIGSNDILVTGPNGFSKSASLVGPPPTQNQSEMSVEYDIAGPFNASTNGSYQVFVVAGSVSDNASNFMPSTLLGAFSCAVGVVAQNAVTHLGEPVTHLGEPVTYLA
jgi:hypothetical protein